MKWQELHERYARLLWGVHSAWALVSGIAVLVLAHNRYGFLQWAVLFIALTWASTLFFSRFAIAPTSGVARFAHTVVSYLTRVMYQETLFFLIPFYFYSATFPSWNFLYVLALAALAVLSCFDMVFDRLLRDRRWFSIGFFAFVSFSALQLFLPLLLRTRIEAAAYLAAIISFLAAVALARGWGDLRDWRRVGVIVLALLAVLVCERVLRPLLPPVPLRMTRIAFSGEIDPRTLKTRSDFEKEIPAAELRHGYIAAVARVVSPERIPAEMQMRFLQKGKVLSVSRVVKLTAHRGEYRIWGSVRVPPKPSSNTYRVELWTGGQLLGKRDVKVVQSAEGAKE